MSVEQNKQSLQRFYDEVFNAGNLDVADELIAVDAVDHEEALPGTSGTTPQVIKQVVALFRSAFPDLRIMVHDLIGEGDKVVARITLSGTHQGEFLGMLPTGKPVDVQIIDILRYDNDGMMVEHWGVTDNLGMMQQLGVIPAQGAPAA